MSKAPSNAMLVSLSLSMFSPKATDKKVTKEVINQHQATEDSGKFIKTILPKVALDSLKKLQGEIREYHYDNTLPWSVEGAAILPSASYLAYTDKMRGFNRRWDELVDAFIERYDEFKDSARQSLNGMFNPDDYPDKDRVRKKFKFKTDFLPFPDSSDFRLDMAEEELAELRDQTAQRINEATERARREVWQRLATPLKTMAARLSDPSAKIFDTVVSNLSDIVSLIPSLNITNDPDLDKIRGLVLEHGLNRVSVETLRKSPRSRMDTAQRANEILATMADYLPSDAAAPAAPPMELPPLEVLSAAASPEEQTTSLLAGLESQEEPATVIPLILPTTPAPVAAPSWRSRLAHSL